MTAEQIQTAWLAGLRISELPTSVRPHARVVYDQMTTRLAKSTQKLSAVGWFNEDPK